MHTLRLTLYFVIGVLLVSVPLFSYAAGPTWGPWTRGEPVAVCNADYAASILAANGWTQERIDYFWTNTGQIAVCKSKCTDSAKCGAQWFGVVGSYGTGNSRTATCSSGTFDNLTGTCSGSDVCPTTEQGSGWYSYPSSSTSGIGGQYCVNGCQITLAWDLSEPTIYESATKSWRRYSGYGDGVACSSGNGLPVSNTSPPTEPPKDPPCAPGEKVIGKSDGGVNCVPANTPDADTPKVKQEQKKETFPDGSEKNITTTETCNGTNACSTNTVTNVTNNSAGQPGQAGPPGTTTSSGVSKNGESSEENQDICKANPNLQICKGGISEETTQRKVLQELERFNNPGATEDSELKAHAATAIASSDAVKNQDKELAQYVAGEKTNEGIEGQKGAWASAMSSGWIDPIELGGCAPIVSHFADKIWTLDVCPTAAKISEIGAYAMWFLLAVGAFVMVTGGKQG